MTKSNTALNQLLASMNLSRSGCNGRVGAHVAESVRVAVPARSVSSLLPPATSLIDATITTDQEVVANVRPAQRVDVIVLDVAHLLVAGRSGAAGVAGGVVNDGIGGRVGWQVGAAGRPGAPLGAAHNGGAFCEGEKLFVSGTCSYYLLHFH